MTVEPVYYAEAIDLCADELLALEAEKFIERRPKIVAILRNAAHYYRADLTTLRQQQAETQRDSTEILQAVLDAIKGTIDTSTNIADHPNVKFAQMQRLHWKTELAETQQERDAAQSERESAVRQFQAAERACQRLQAERDGAGMVTRQMQDRVAAFQASFRLCDLHAPEVWEGSGTCVLCEAVQEHAAISALQQQIRRLVEQWREVSRTSQCFSHESLTVGHCADSLAVLLASSLETT